MRAHHIYPRQTQHTSPEHRQHGGQQGLPIASHGRGSYLVGVAQEQRQQRSLHPDLAIADDLRVCREQPQARLTRGHKSQADDKAGQRAEQHALPIHSPATVIFAGGVILAGECHRRAAESRHHQIPQRLVCQRSGIARHSGGSVAVDRRLHKHVGNGKEHALESGGESDAEDCPHLRPVDADVLEVQAEITILPEQHPHNGGRADDIGHVSGYCYPLDPEMEHQHQNEIEHGVDYASGNQHIQRALSVPSAAQNGCPEVEYHYERSAEKINAQIQQRLIHDVVRSAHRGQQRPRHQQSGHQQEQPHIQGESRRGAHPYPDPPPVPHAYMPGYDSIRAKRNADEQVEKQGNDSSVRPHGRESLTADKTPDDYDINSIEELLEHAAGRNRQRKQQHLAQHGAVEHVYLSPHDSLKPEPG